MDQVNLNKQASRWKNPVAILSLVSLIFTVLSSITYFVLIGTWGLLSLLVGLVPYVLMVIYIFKFYDKPKAAVLMHAILALVSTTPVFLFIMNSINGSYYSITGMIRIFAIAISFGLASYGLLKGFRTKLFITIAASIGLFDELISIVRYFSGTLGWYLEEGLYLYPLRWTLETIGAIALYVALLLLALRNEIPAIAFEAKKKKEMKAKDLTPEQALRMLKSKWESGTITEEEYQAQRAEIISKL